MNTSHQYDLVLGLDRADKKADLCFIETAGGNSRNAALEPKLYGNGWANLAPATRRASYGEANCKPNIVGE